MKYTYAYKTSDGQRHEATIEAASREAVFSELRKQGIRAIKVVATDGSKANGEIVVRGVRRRVVTVGALCLVLCALCGIVAAFWLGRGRSPSAPQSNNQTIQPSNTSPTAPRHQIYGDPARWEEIEQDHFASVFTNLGDRILAQYAIPGRTSDGLAWLQKTGAEGHIRRASGARDSSEPSRAQASAETFRANFDSLAAEAVSTAVSHDLVVLPDDPREVAELKRIVQGMKVELRWYLGDGVGSVPMYLKRLAERQDEECRIYEQARKELESVTDRKLRDERNAALRALGLRTIPRPKAQ